MALEEATAIETWKSPPLDLIFLISRRCSSFRLNMGDSALDRPLGEARMKWASPSSATRLDRTGEHRYRSSTFH